MSVTWDEIKRSAILMIDDDPAIVDLLTLFLQGRGYLDLSSCTDPRNAQGIIEGKDFDLIILDLNMPHVDGFEILEYIRGSSAYDTLSVLVLSAQGDSPSRIRALEMGARDFLSKPFEKLELVTRIHNMLEVQLLNKELRRQNQRLEEQVRARTLELYETRLEIIRRLGRAAEYKDADTGTHILRMSRIAEHLTLAIGLNRKAADLVLQASPMHDIGKIGIPDSILLKQGKLEPSEWIVMQSHTRIGADMLAGHDSELMEKASDIALCHHEKWDGSGYPEGLVGEEIPLFARIAAVADVFDALTMARPYKPAWSVAESIALIRSESGKHFEPRLVSALEQTLPDILTITDGITTGSRLPAGH